MNGKIDINRNDRIVFKSLHDMPKLFIHNDFFTVDAKLVAGKTAIVSRVDRSIYGSRFRFITFIECDTGIEGAVQVCEEMVDYVVRNADDEEEYEGSDDLTIFIDGFVEVP